MYLVSFVRSDMQPKEEYFYHDFSSAYNHLSLFETDDSGLYRRIDLIEIDDTKEKILKSIEF